MLVQFSFKNFRSFKEETILDMTAINAYKEHEYNLIHGEQENYLRVASIYGANASGKSNFSLAYGYFRGIVVESSNNVESGKQNILEKCYCPFKLDGENNNTEFQIISIIDGDEYKYGFEYNDKHIISEWFYRKSKETNRVSIIFERANNSKIKFGNSIRKECEIFGEQISDETLVLSFFYKLKLSTDVFKRMYIEITGTTSLNSDAFDDEEFLKKFLPPAIDAKKEKLMEFLRCIDTGIVDIEYVKERNDVEFYSYHLDETGGKRRLPLFWESDGTLKCISIFIYAIVVIEVNQVLIVDELNVKLHPLLLKFIVDMFYNNSSKAQLIYTTHDTTLMDKKFFRRDQIWFVQKDQFGHSELYALSDFKVRSDASFEKDYLSGVYGGIPMLKEFEQVR